MSRKREGRHSTQRFAVNRGNTDDDAPALRHQALPAELEPELPESSGSRLSVPPRERLSAAVALASAFASG